MRYSSRVRRSCGFTLIEILLVLAIVGVLSAMAVAGYRSAKLRAGESSAIGTLSAINAAQFAYMQTCGNQRYAPTLVALGVPVPGSSEAFLSPDLAASDPLAKSGYLIQMSGNPAGDALLTCTGATPTAGYQATADPVTPGWSGDRYFGTNAERVIFEDTTTFSGHMPETGAPPHGTEIK